MNKISYLTNNSESKISWFIEKSHKNEFHFICEMEVLVQQYLKLNQFMSWGN